MTLQNGGKKIILWTRRITVQVYDGTN